MSLFEKIQIKKYVRAKDIISGLLFVGGTLLLILAQKESHSVDELQNNRTETILEFVGVKLGITELKTSMNEYLLRYLTSQQIYNEEMNNTYSLFCVNTPSGETIQGEFQANLSACFDPQANLQYYFNDTSSLNCERSVWYQKEAEFSEILLQADKEILNKINTHKNSRNNFENIAILLYGLGFLIALSSIRVKESKNNSKSLPSTTN
jgi:hypothetical protein